MKNNGISVPELTKNCFVLNKWNAKVIISDVPSTGNEEHFDIIRDELERRYHFDFMKRSNEGNWISRKLEYDDHSKSGLLVGLDFERKYLLSTRTTPIQPVSDVSMSMLWYVRVIEPSIKRNQTVLLMQNNLEAQIKNLLQAILLDEKYWPIFGHILTNIDPLDRDAVLSVLYQKWQMMFKCFINECIKRGCRLFYNNSAINTKNQVDRIIISPLFALCCIRNCIAHNSGYISPVDLKKASFPGVDFYVNMIFIKKSGIEAIENYVTEVYNLLRQIIMEFDL
jgi:hypothetical protein